MNENQNVEVTTYVDRTSARLGGLMGLSFGFGLGLFMGHNYILGSFMLIPGFYSWYHSRNADIRQLKTGKEGEDNE